MIFASVPVLLSMPLPILLLVGLMLLLVRLLLALIPLLLVLLFLLMRRLLLRKDPLLVRTHRATRFTGSDCSILQFHL